MDPEELEKEQCAYCEYTLNSIDKNTEERIILLKQYILETSILVAAGHGQIVNSCDVKTEQALEDLESVLNEMNQRLENELSKTEHPK